MFRATMAMMLSRLAQENRLKVVDDLTTDCPKTREIVKKFANLKVSGKILLAVDKEDENLMLAIRNLPNVFCVRQISLTPVHLLFADVVIFPQKTLTKCMGLWQ